MQINQEVCLLRPAHQSYWNYHTKPERLHVVVNFNFKFSSFVSKYQSMTKFTKNKNNFVIKHFLNYTFTFSFLKMPKSSFVQAKTCLVQLTVVT